MKKPKNKEEIEISDYLNLLIAIGKMGGIRRPVFSTTSELGRTVGISQQSASRKLTKLENSNYIVRNYKQRGNTIKITPIGVAALEHVFTDLWMILSAEGREISEKIVIKGTVCTGMGEGAYYMSQKEYLNQFASLLEFEPYPGTLNLQLLEDSSLRNFERLLRSPSKFIKEFTKEGRRFGKVFVWPTYLLIGNRKISAALIHPDRTHHNNQIEIIAKEHIKTTYEIKDGDELELILQ
ncbi:MAG: DUF120 domain-containing protein [Candidatus Heimdallarchaeota archaeon]|nr:MAG: DUF120 domain-containing protein [Candidatus Heimdallarchaeota archaeon]